MLELMPPFYFLTYAKVSVSVSKTFGLEKSLGIGLKNIWSRKKVSVSVSKIFGLEKSLGNGLDEIFWSCHSVLVCAKTGSEGGKKCHRGKNIVSSGNVCTAFLFILGHSRPRAG